MDVKFKNKINQLLDPENSEDVKVKASENGKDVGVKDSENTEDLKVKGSENNLDVKVKDEPLESSEVKDEPLESSEVKDEPLESSEDMLSGCHSEQVWAEEGIMENKHYLETDFKSEIEVKDEPLDIVMETTSNDKVEHVSELDENKVYKMSIKSLKNFKNLSYQEKLEIISNGRPTPLLKKLKQPKGTKVMRSFNANAWYCKKEWLCGCNETNKLFCFPCLLFSTNASVWTTIGYENLNNLTNALAKHERSISHLQSQVSLKTFGSSNIDLALNEQRKINIELHNKKVKENREILKTFIDAACFLIKQEIPFCCSEESESLNRSNYQELLKFVAKRDEKLSQHFESSSVFLNTSNKIQNDLIKAISTSLENNIKEEIKTVQFIAVEVDEATDISNKAQCSTVLRYVIGAEVKEAFIGFDELCDRTIDEITKKIFTNLDNYSCTQKLVAQTYDGALVAASYLNGVQSKIKEKVPSALFTHCHSHNLNLILSQSAVFIPECTRFFKTIEALASFFTYSTKRAQFLDEIVKKRLPKATPTKWSSNLKLVHNVLLHYSDLCKFFQDIKNTPATWDADTVVKSSVFFQFLTDESMHFLLFVYDRIFSVTDVLFTVIKTKMVDIQFCMKHINKTLNSLKMLQKLFEGLYQQFEESCVKNNLASSTNPSSKEKNAILFCSIFDDVIKNITIRYKDFENLEFITLADSKKFKSYCSKNKVCKKAITRLESIYGGAFDIIKLKSELFGIYNTQIFYDKNIKDILHFIFQNKLQETFPETVKLLQLILTLPTTIFPVEKSFSALERIKMFSRNRMTSERLSELALASIEKERIIQMEKDKSFPQKVSEIFINSQDRRMEYIYI